MSRVVPNPSGIRPVPWGYRCPRKLIPDKGGSVAGCFSIRWASQFFGCKLEVIGQTSETQSVAEKQKHFEGVGHPSAIVFASPPAPL